MGWEVLIPALLKIGVSWATIHAAQRDSGLDDEQIAKNKERWIPLVDDIRRAAEGR